MGNWFSSGRIDNSKSNPYTKRYGRMKSQPVAIKPVVSTVVPNINNSNLQPASNRPPLGWELHNIQTPVKLVTAANNPQSVVNSNSNSIGNGNRNRNRRNTTYEVLNEGEVYGGARFKKNKRTRKNHKKGL